MQSEEYKNIFRELFNILFDWSMHFSNTSKKYIEKYHIVFAALMYINYFIELELFELIYNNYTYNIESCENKNNYKSIFENDVSTNLTRIYKINILDHFTIYSKLKYFSEELDKIFYNFMETLIYKLSKTLEKNISDIKFAITGNNNSTNYDHIDITWKDKLCYKDTVSRHKDSCINIINSTIKDVLLHYFKDNTKYIAEGVGFFGFIYLKFYSDMNTPDINKNMFGSCITFSLLEFYFMSRLHISGEKIVLLLETRDENKPHTYWKYTQKSVGMSLTHWATLFELSSGDQKYRSLLTYSRKINFITDFIKFVKALIYPIYDSYNQFITINSNITNHSQISTFITTRHTLFESILSEYYTDINLFLTNIITYPPNKPPVYDTEKKYYFRFNIDTINNTINLFNQHLLYIACRIGNFDLVNKLLSLKGINLLVKTSDDSSILHGLCYGYKIEISNEERANKIKILELILQKCLEEEIDFRQMLYKRNHHSYAFDDLRDVKLKEEFKEKFPQIKSKFI